MTQSSLVVYAYRIGSAFDYGMWSYGSTLYGLNPATLDQPGNVDRVWVSGALLEANLPMSNSSTGVSASMVNSSTETLVTLASPPPAGYSLVGCFTEIPGLVLSDRMEVSTQNSPLACSQICSSSQYFGVENGEECYCGKAIDSKSLKVIKGCDTSCPGNSRQTCGGVDLLSIYQKGTGVS